MSKLDDEYPISRMNVDDEERKVPKGEYRLARNVRNGTPYIKKGGMATNVRGNVIIPTYLCPYNGGTFPTGRNKTIGSYEDTINDTVIFFNWNSQGRHGIYRWYRGKADSNNPHGIVEQIIQYNFRWTQKENITSISYVVSTSGDLVYWIDSTGLRKINIDRANINNKQKSWVFYFPKTNPFTTASRFRFRLLGFNGNLIVDVNFRFGTYDNTNDGIAAIAAEINSTYNSHITAEACNCSLKITEVKTTSFYYEFLGTYPPTTPFPCLVVPDNWYGTSLVDRMFDRVPYPPLNPPIAEYRKDPQTLFNNVRNRVFQFCLEYGYYDFEKTVLGVYSQIPINNLQCDGTVSDAYNFINVDFNDDQIPLETTLVTLKDVAVLAKEGNTTVFREVLRIEPCDFLDYNYTTQDWFCSYDFYNNIQSTVTTNNPERLESGVPIRANAEVYNKDRIVVGGVELGRNNVDCAEADYTITIDDTPQQVLHKITGLIRVFNPLMGNDAQNYPDETTQPNALQRRSAIIYDETLSIDGSPVYPCFGGSYYANNVVEINSDWAYNKKRQILPEGGWAVYAAGTDFFTISKQILRDGVSQRSDGSIDVSNNLSKDALKDLYAGYNAGTTPPFKAENDIYSTFELLVPDGEYIIRLASHWCSYNDKLGKGWMYDLNGSAYQTTSTFVWSVGDYRRGYQYDYEIKVTVSGGDVFIGEFLVSDLVLDISTLSSVLTGVAASMSGYLFDSNGRVDVERLAQGQTVELGLGEIKPIPGQTPNKIRPYLKKITDHNGYFFCYGITTGINYSNKPVCTQVGGIIHAAGSPVYYEDPTGESALKKLYSGTITQTFDFSNIPSHIEEIVPTDTEDARLKSATFISGSVRDGIGANSLPIPNVNIAYQHGRVVLSDTRGDYSLLAWGDYRANTNNRLLDSLIFNGQIFCTPTYPNGQFFLVQITAFGANISTIPPPYSPTAKYIVPPFVIEELNDPNKKALKRGGSYLVGVRYNDEQGRLCSVASWFELYIPFETEDLGTYPNVVDSNGNTYPTGTYRGGKPTVNWTLNYTPPQYASDMQIVLTKNLFQKPSYLQWVVSSVTYLSAVQTEATPEVETSFENQNAVAVKLSISSVITYAANNPGSQIGFTYNAGDRLRPMYDRNLNLISGLQDFEVISFDAQTTSVIIKSFNKAEEIKSGFVVEIYNPQTVDSSESQIYYEVGEVYKCVVDTNTGKKIHSAVAGTLTCGDTYWHGRNILVNDDKDNFGANYPVIIESASVSDFFTSQVSDIGRRGIIDPNFKQLFYPSRLVVSDQFQQDSAYNGLSAFSALNTKDEGRQYGEVSRLIMKGKTLHAIMKNNNVSNYIGVVTFRYAQSTQGVQAIADDYLGTQEPSLSNIGTQHPASVSIYDGYIYGLSDLRKGVWRHATDGMNEISRNAYTDASGTARTRMVNYFKELCEEGVWDAISIYDKRHREYILTVWKTATANGIFTQGIEQTGLGTLATVRVNSVVLVNEGDVISVTYANSITGEKLTNEVSVTGVTYLPTIPQSTNIQFFIPEGQIARASEVIIRYKGEGKTIAWNEEKNGWTSEYSFLPEVYGALGDEIVSFKDGKIWLHDKNPIHNNFYGVQYETVITPVFNDESNNVKVWNALWCMMYQDNNRCDFYSDNVSNNNGQLSRLKAPNFVKKEEFWFTEFKRDLNDTTVANPIINGRNMRSTAITVELKNGYTGEINMYGWRVNWSNSERTSR